MSHAKPHEEPPVVAERDGPPSGGSPTATPVVSVLMPTYERAQYIGSALDSALAQNFDDFEILIGDNSETDATEALVSTYDDPRIRYHRNRPGLGAQGNWLDLVARARGPLVATLHDDDIWDSSFLESVVPPMLEDPTVAMTFNDFWIIDEWGNRLERFTESESARTHRSDIACGRLELSRDEALRLVAVWNAPQPAYAAVVRTEDILTIGFPDEIAPLYDIWLSYRLVMDGRALRYERRRLTSYRVHSGSSTASGWVEPEDEVFRRIIAENADHPAVVGEIKRYWAGLRWARAMNLMYERGSCHSSQRELIAASEDLPAFRRVLARTAGRSAIGWRCLRLAKIAIDRPRRSVIEGQ